MNFAEGEKLFLFDLFPCADIGGFGKEGSDLGGAILLQLSGRTLRDDPSSTSAGLRPHLDNPIRCGKDLRVVVDQYN